MKLPLLPVELFTPLSLDLSLTLLLLPTNYNLHRHKNTHINAPPRQYHTLREISRVSLPTTLSCLLFPKGQDTRLKISSNRCEELN